jgi:CDP-4-dehydro-6-deoxyglucose reductase
MPDPKFVQPWHGVPRDQIDWHPVVDEEMCIGCGLCVTGCGRGVFAYDYQREKPVVVEPLHCMVGCVTCANVCGIVCPESAITFPPLERLHKLIKAKKVLVHVKKQELPEGRQRWALKTEAVRTK